MAFLRSRAATFRRVTDGLLIVVILSCSSASSWVASCR